MDAQTPRREPKWAKPHGTRTRYIYNGCRCVKCTRANSRYQRTYRRQGPQFVGASKARHHINKLRAQGYGARLIAHLAGVDRTTVLKIAAWDRERISRITEAAILAVQPETHLPGTYLDSGPTLALLKELLALGFTKRRLALLLGSTAKVPSLQLNRPVIRARNAYKVQRLYDRVMDFRARGHGRRTAPPTERTPSPCLESKPQKAISELTGSFLFRPPRPANGQKNAPSC